FEVEDSLRSIVKAAATKKGADGSVVVCRRKDIRLSSVRLRSRLFVFSSSQPWLLGSVPHMANLLLTPTSQAYEASYSAANRFISLKARARSANGYLTNGSPLFVMAFLRGQCQWL
ncbi:hypothetical protein HaLaN_30289, partial [Haematococcus lacustris]